MTPFFIERGGVFILPVLHERLEFADLARRALESLRPDGVAVEVPSSPESVWRRAATIRTRRFTKRFHRQCTQVQIRVRRLDGYTTTRRTVAG